MVAAAFSCMLLAVILASCAGPSAGGAGGPTTPTDDNGPTNENTEPGEDENDNAADTPADTDSEDDEDEDAAENDNVAPDEDASTEGDDDEEVPENENAADEEVVNENAEDETEEDETVLPEVSLDPARTVLGGDSVTLTCEQTAGDRADSFLWHQTAGTDAGVEGATTKSVSFTAPASSDTLTFTCEGILDGVSGPGAVVNISVRALTLALLVKESDNAPDTTAAIDGKFDTIDTSQVRISSAGTTAFCAQLSGTANDDGIFTATGSQVSAVARKNDTAPGTNGRAYDQFFGLSINGDDDVAFMARVTLSAARGAFLDEGLDQTLLGLQAQPNAPNGETYISLSAGIGLDNFSDTRFTGQTQISHNAVIHIPRSGVGEYSVKEGADAPGTAEATFTAFGTTVDNFAVSESGHCVFAAETSVRVGIWLLPRPGFFRAVALANENTPAGGTYAWTDHEAILLDVSTSDEAKPHIAYVAPIADGPAEKGIFLGRDGEFATVALHGDLTPNETDTLDTFSSLAVNGSGNVVFSSGLAGGTSAVFFYDAATGSILEIATDGQTIPGGGGTFSQFYAVDLNDGDTAAFVADYTSGTTTVTTRTAVITAALP